MISPAVWLLLLSTASSPNQNAETDILKNDNNSVSILPADREKATSKHETDSSVALPGQEIYAGRHLLSVYQPRWADDGIIMAQPDKKTKRKMTLDNNTGLRKVKQRPNGESNVGASAEASLSSRNVDGKSQTLSQDENQNEDSHSTDPLLDKTTNDLQDPMDPTAAANGFNAMDHDSNRPSKIHPYKPAESFRNHSKSSWVTNRHPSSLLFQFNPFRKGSESKEKLCLSECHKERDERESYCNSDFAVNGIVHAVETLSKGTQLLTLLVNSAGLYKMNRLYITPDGFFFRVKMLAVDPLRCQKPCLDFKLGIKIYSPLGQDDMLSRNGMVTFALGIPFNLLGQSSQDDMLSRNSMVTFALGIPFNLRSRYIVMGQIYHKRMELPSSIQEMVSGRLRPGDGLVRSGSYIRRFNRKKERKVLAIAHNKCK